MEKKYIKTRMKIEDIQSNLDELPTIRFEKNITFTTISSIINHAIDNNYRTDNKTYCSKTNRLQCRSSTKRGIADLYRLCKYYIPDVTLKQVVNYMKNRPSTQYGYCCTTNQDVFKNSSIGTMNWSQGTDIESYKCSRNDPSIRLKTRKRVFIEND